MFYLLILIFPDGGGSIVQPGTQWNIFTCHASGGRKQETAGKRLLSAFNATWRAEKSRTIAQHPQREQGTLQAAIEPRKAAIRAMNRFL